MESEACILFHPFRLDPVNERLWRGEQPLPLRPKPFAILRYLVAHADTLVTKAELLAAVWQHTHVAEGVLRGYIRDLRAVLGDDPAAPRFIETVERRGYRFIAPLTPNSQPVSSFKFQVSSSKSKPAPSLQPLTPSIVGREAELEQLHGWLEQARGGERQIVFVTGEPGIGKTAVVDTFLADAAAAGGLWLGHGQCIDHYGAGEAYLPVLAALGQLGREPGQDRLITLLRQQAPTWLVQLPALLSAVDLEALQRQTLGATRERMLREMAEALEVLTAERPLVLVLEDLHWSDAATLNLLAFVARRRQPARLLVIGTYRPVEVIVRAHPLKAVKQELQLHGYCAELPLRLLTAAAVGEYLAGRFPVHLLPAALARMLHQRTEGNPLFIVAMVDEWVAQGVIAPADGQWALQRGVEEAAGRVPESLHQLIEQQRERLSPEEQRVVEAASVAGAEFSAAAVAAGVEAEVVDVEARCEGFVRRNYWLQVRGIEEWPDGTVAARYGFLHSLYQEVMYERVTAGRRVRLHQRIGEREESAYGERAGEIAAELAVHFERGREYRRAVRYRQLAGENALRRSAHVEAISHFTRGLEVLQTLPDTPERMYQELRLQITLGVSLMVTKGFAAAEVATAYTRARELCRQVGDTPQLFPALSGLWIFYFNRAELRTARELGEQLFSLAQRVQDPAHLLPAYRALGISLAVRGEFASAREHLEHGIALYDPPQHRSLALLYGQDPGVECLSHAAWVLWHLGYPQQALQRSHEALTLARELSYPSNLAFALGLTSWLHQFRREGHLTRERAEVLIALSSEQGFPQWLAGGTMLRGWALAEQGQMEEGIAQMRQGLAVHLATGGKITQPYWLALLAEVYGKAGQTEEGLTALAEALAAVDKTGECHHEAELYRLKGELSLQSGVRGPRSEVTKPQTPTPNPQSEAEACFLKAIEIARRQQAKSLELRAVMSLSRLWQQQGKKKKARQLLAEIYGWFTEGFDTKDLQEAKVLLAALM